ncbi:hypothetical protein [Marinovum sp.]|uniref:hypothetical protein n=1 Tax=Marinovum sp. TaxID=2024839 RepID=UPI002B2684F1|nr:hypothetical protein [Marinovum sp.]
MADLLGALVGAALLVIERMDLDRRSTDHNREIDHDAWVSTSDRQLTGHPSGRAEDNFHARWSRHCARDAAASCHLYRTPI